MLNSFFCKKRGASLLILALFFGPIGCATYTAQIRKDRQKIENDDFASLLPDLEKRSSEENKDQLISILDYASALQWAGDYKKSSIFFGKGDKLADQLDYVSITKNIGAALGGEESIQYKGESYEKFLINSLNALNYLMMNNFEAALVEARRINEKIVRTKMEGRPPYEQSSWAPFLSGLIWEADGNWDNATISYETSYKINPSNPLLPEALVRSNYFANRNDTYLAWKKKFPNVKDPAKAPKTGEIIVIHLQGWIPEKVPSPESPRLPTLKPVMSEIQSAQVTLDGVNIFETKTVYEIGAEAKRTLDADRGALIARRVGGIAAKAVVSDQIRQKDSTLGALAWIAMNVADRADLRQWGMIPDKIQMARIPVVNGTYNLILKGIGRDNLPKSTKKFDNLVVERNKKVFVIWRSNK